MACRVIVSSCKQPSAWGRNMQAAWTGRPKARLVQVQAKKGDGSIEDMIKKKNAENKVMIYSKTYCPYCSRAKDLFLNQLKTNATVAELDNIVEGSDIQATLKRITGSGTVPQIFINGEYVGGCTDVMALHSSGKLVPKLDAAGVKHA